MKELTHIDLFSGIGGFSYAGEMAGFKTIAFCEKDRFCQEILKKRFGAITDTEFNGRIKITGQNKSRWQTSKFEWSDRPPILIPDIRDFDGKQFRGATLISGGFPCQPFSVAGKRRSKEDDRYLWPEMFRVIKEVQPRWVLAENVAGIVNLALDEVLSDLESAGYQTGTLIIPACSVNAPHRRDRVWVIAHAESREPRFSSESERGKNSGRGSGKSIEADFTNPNATGLQRYGGFREYSREIDVTKISWEKSWYKVATRLCGVDDGLPARVDGFELSKSRHRMERIKALGNAIVPQLAHELLKAIAILCLSGKNRG